MSDIAENIKRHEQYAAAVLAEWMKEIANEHGPTRRDALRRAADLLALLSDAPVVEMTAPASPLDHHPPGADYWHYRMHASRPVEPGFYRLVAVEETE